MSFLKVVRGNRRETFLTDDNSIMLSASDIFFWLGIMCEFIVNFSGFLFGDYNEPLITVIGMGFFAVKIMLSADYKKDIPVIALLILYGLVCFRVQDSAIILRMILVLVAGRDQDARQVIRFFFYGTAAVMLVAAVMSAMGLHNTLYNEEIYRHGDFQRRYTFGFYQPNGFAFYWFRLLAMGIFLYNKKIRWWGYLIISAIVIVPSILCDSKMGMLITIVLLIGSIVIRLIGEGKLFKAFYILGNIYMVTVIAFIYIAMVFFNGYFAPDGDTPAGFWEPLDFYLFNGRLEFARRAFYSNTITLFGHHKSIMTVETGYVSGLFVYGLIFMILFFVMMFYLFYCMYKRKNKEGMLLILCSATYFVAEPFIGYINKNLILMAGIGTLLTTSVYVSKDKKPEPFGNPDGKRIKIAFADFWKDLDLKDNYIVNILKKHYLIEISDKPDYCFCSCFGNDHLKYADSVKIFFTGENIVPDFNEYDYAMGFSYIDFEDRYLRLPLYAMYDKAIEKAKVKQDIDEKTLLAKKKACAVVVSNPDAAGIRDNMIDELSKVMDVASGGRYKNNVGGPVKDKLAFLEDYRLSLAFENSDNNGYTTEKILEAFAAGTIPVYWGSKDIKKEFNPEAFIDVNDFDTVESAAGYIKSVAEDDDKFLRMMKAPMVTPESEAYIILSEDYAEGFLCNIIDTDKEKAFRRNNKYAGRRYQLRREHAYQMVRITDLINKPLHTLNKIFIQKKAK